MMTFNFEPFDGHILANIDGNVVLVDTGSPVTIGPGRSLPSFGKTEIAGTLPGVSVSRISELLGRPFDILLGVDILGEHPFVVDWLTCTITFDPDIPPEGLSIPLKNIGGCPTVQARINGQEVKLALDTGCKVCYLKSALTEGAEPVGSFDDFYITIGAFRCDSFKKRVEVGSAVFDLTVGTLPPTFESGLKSIALDGILGNDISGRYPKLFYDLENRCLTLCG